MILSAKSIKSLWKSINENYKYLNRNKGINIGDLCYTYTVCRNHYKYRIGIISTNINELIFKLQEIINKGFEGFEKEQKDKKYRVENLEGIYKIKESYENGENINWNHIYDNYQYRKIPLPTYMFEENECWINIPDKNSSSLYNIESLINSNNISDELKDTIKKVLKEIDIDTLDKSEEENNIKILGKEDGNYTVLERNISSIWCNLLGLK